MRFDNKLDEIMEREDINELTKYVTFTACTYAGRRRGSRPSLAGVHLKAKLSLWQKKLKWPMANQKFTESLNTL